jgi:putative hydrolase of the HAD superfamily
MPKDMREKIVLIDADDTLWENNIYFEQVRTQYLDWMRGLGCDLEQVNRTIDLIERKNVQLNGYGGENFVQSLKETYLCFRRQAGPAESEMAAIDEMASHVRHHPIELLEGVRESLAILSYRHQTILLTKGNPTEQTRKIESSGLAGYFKAIEIVREKDIESFRELIARRQLPKRDTCMVGNSPKSDINPAVNAGIRAFYIPHARTWEMEKEELCISDQITILERFSELLHHL